MHFLIFVLVSEHSKPVTVSEAPGIIFKRSCHCAHSLSCRVDDEYVYAWTYCQQSSVKCASGGDSENTVRKNLVWLKSGSKVGSVVKSKTCTALLGMSYL